MNKCQNMNYAAPFTEDAYAFLLPGSSSFEISFDCATVPTGPHFTVLPDMPDWSDTPDKVAGYTILQHIARSFTRWITVTWLEFCEIVRTIIRIFCDSIDRAAFKRNTYIREGVFRL